MDRGTWGLWGATVHGGTKEPDITEQLNCTPEINTILRINHTTIKKKTYKKIISLIDLWPFLTGSPLFLFLSVPLSLSISLSHIKCLLHFALLDIP